MQERYPIPDYVLDAYNKCDFNLESKSVHFPRRQFANASKDDPRVQAWFDMITEEVGLDLSPNNIFQICIRHHLAEYRPTRCPTCGKLLSINSAKIGVEYCSNKCAQLNPSIAAKREQTFLKNYGVTNPNLNKTVLEKRLQTNKDRYGGNAPICDSRVKDKIKQTNLDRYGVENTYTAESVKERIKQTNIERYGVDNPNKSKEVRAKIAATNRERYGGNAPLCSAEVKAKAVATNLEKYGVDNPNKTTATRAKIAATNRERYGGNAPLCAKEVKDKVRATTLARYGVEYIMQSKAAKAKAVATSLEHYGVANPNKSKEVQAKIAATNRERYGVDCVLQNPKIIEKSKRTVKTKHYPVFVKLVKAKNISVLSDIEAYVSSKVLKFKCNTCGYLWTRDLQKMPLVNGTRSVYCKKCCTQASMAEKELMFFIKSIYSGEVIENTKSIIKPYELDIYLPEKKLAIEFNGTYWHSFKPSEYHQNKTFLCKEQDIRLIHVFEHEWTFNKNKVMQHIKNALGIFEVSIYARQCQVKAISSNEYREFLDINHLQGAINSSVRLGLFYKDELVSVIGFGKSRFKKDELELHRYCVKAGYQVVGGFSKLLKHSKQTDFVSYVDLSHFTGKGYEKLGFVPIAITSPSYVYVKNDEIKSRMQCQKHKLSAFLSNFDEELSESDNMSLNGWYKVYDCGNLKLKYSINE